MVAARSLRAESYAGAIAGPVIGIITVMVIVIYVS